MRVTRIIPALVPIIMACSTTTNESPPSNTPNNQPEPAPADNATAKEASALQVKLEPRSGSNVSGTATFIPDGPDLRVIVEVHGAPRGQIATHIHEKGDCSSPDAKSAGEHFNPENHKHGLPDGEHHLGDLGNIDVDYNGDGTHEVVEKGANLTPGDPKSVRGKAIIVHAKTDDGGQPSGNAGDRIACAVIQ